MSDPYTQIRTPSAGFLALDHVSYAEALAQFRRCYEDQLEEAQKALAELESGEVQVFHQRGVHVARDRREVLPDE